MTDEDGFIDSYWEDQAERAYEGNYSEDPYDEEEEEEYDPMNEDFGDGDFEDDY